MKSGASHRNISTCSRGPSAEFIPPGYATAHCTQRRIIALPPGWGFGSRHRWTRLTQCALLLAGSALGVVAQTNPAPSASNPNPVAVSFELRQGHIMVPVHVNNSEPLSFMLDTGYSMTMIHPESVEKAQLKPTG